MGSKVSRIEWNVGKADPTAEPTPEPTADPTADPTAGETIFVIKFEA